MIAKKYKFSNLRDLAEHFFECGAEQCLDIYNGRKKKEFEDYWKEVETE